MMYRSILKGGLFLLAIFLSGCKVESQKKEISKEEESLNINLNSVPKTAILSNEDYNIWGGSIVGTEDGVYHMFYARWPKDSTFKGWLKYSEIAHATAKSPLGPFTFERVVLKGFGKDFWNEEAAHNPSIKKFGDKYYLYFISHTKEERGLSDWLNHIFGQRIGVAVADDPSGSWEVVPEPLIEYQEGKPAHGYMVNPSVCEQPDGTYLMMFKARKEGAEKSKTFDPIHCVATAPTPVGPFTIAKETLLTEHTAEDPYVWIQNGKYYSLVKDMHAKYTGFKSLALFESKNGLDWKPSKNILVSKTQIDWEDGSTWKLQNLERPQLLFNDKGEPIVLSCAARLAIVENCDLKTTFNVQIPIQTEFVKE